MALRVGNSRWVVDRRIGRGAIIVGELGAWFINGAGDGIIDGRF